MNQDEDTTIQKLTPGTWHGRVIRHEHNEVPGKILLIEDREYFFPENNPSIFFREGSWVQVIVDDQGNQELKLIQETSISPTSSGDILRWRRPGQNPSRMHLLKKRHQLFLETRKWFDQQGFIETETPLMVQAPSPEAQFSLMQVHGETRKNEDLPQMTNAFLITSPEYQMKRMLVGGFEKIFQICRCFRNGEIGPLHHPEFTMLEWYRAHGSLRDVMNDVTQLCRYLSTNVSGTLPMTDQSWPILRVRDLFQDKLGIRLSGRESPQELLAQAQDAGMSKTVEDLTESNPEELTYESVFFRLWDQIEPELGRECPVWVWEWPLPLASLARPLPDSPGFADRAECYVNGIELANGFGELTDPEEQLRRFQSDLELREKTSRQPVPLDHKFLQSLREGMPHSAGMALGLDRLLLWLTGTKNISQVLTFSWEEI